MVIKERHQWPRPIYLETQTLATGPRRFSVEEYERIHESGVIGADERVELIRGEIIEMAAIGFRHAETVSLTTDTIAPMIPPNRSWARQPDLPSRSESPPARLRGRQTRTLREPATNSPRTSSLSSRSLTAPNTMHLTVKFPLYAAAGIPEAWLFDLIEDRIQRHTDPGPDGYRQVASVGRGESISSLVLPAVVFVVDDVLAANPN